MEFEWSPGKNAELHLRYGIGFERVGLAIQEGALLDEREHPNKERYAHQRQLVVAIDGYAWVVPCGFRDGTIFLKTMFPSRQASRAYLRGKDGTHKDRR